MNKDQLRKAAEAAQESFDALDRVAAHLSLADDERYEDWRAALDKLRQINSEIMEGRETP